MSGNVTQFSADKFNGNLSFGRGILTGYEAMEDFLKMDVFFVVATIATVVLATLLGVALAYAIRFLRTVNRIGESIEEEADMIRSDIQETRARVKNFRLLHLFPLLGKSAKRIAARSARKKD